MRVALLLPLLLRYRAHAGADAVVAGLEVALTGGYRGGHGLAPHTGVRAAGGSGRRDRASADDKGGRGEASGGWLMVGAYNSPECVR